MDLYKLLLVGAGGFLGSIARYATARSIDGRANAFFPYGTLVVNIVGSFILGLLYGWLFRKTGDNESLRLLVGTGFCGGFTTYSAFALENANLLQQKLISTSIFYILITLVAGFMAVLAGMTLGKNLS